MKICLLGPIYPRKHGSSIVTGFINDRLGEDELISLISLNTLLSERNSEENAFDSRKLLKYFDLLVKAIVTTNIQKVYWVPAPQGIAFWKDYLLLLLVLTRNSKAKVILHIHALGFSEGSIIERIVKKLLLSRSTTLCVTTDMKSDLERKWKSNYYVVDNPVLIAPLTSKKEARNIDILFVSNLFKAKGVLEFVEVVSILRNDLPQIKCEIYGDEADITYTYLHKLIQNKGLQQNISLKGRVAHNKLSNPMSRSKVFFFPSTYEKESFGLVVAESMSFGAVPVAYNIWGVRTLIEDGRDGYLVPKKGIQEASERIKKLLNNDALRAKMTHNSIETASKRYSRDSYWERFLSIIQGA